MNSMVGCKSLLLQQKLYRIHRLFKMFIVLFSSIVVRKCETDDRKGIEVLTKVIKGRGFLIK